MLEKNLLFVFKDKDVLYVEETVGFRSFPLEDEEAETLIRDQSLCLLSCVPQQLLQHFSPFLPPLCCSGKHILSLCSVPAAREIAVQLLLRACS